MASAAARLALAAGFPAFLAGEALAQTPRVPPGVPMPSSVEVGRGLALAHRCRDRDGFTLCSPSQPVGATFRQVLCAQYGADAEHRPIARCVYTGARMNYSGERIGSGRRGTTRSTAFGDGAIDLFYEGTMWLPMRYEE